MNARRRNAVARAILAIVALLVPVAAHSAPDGASLLTPDVTAALDRARIIITDTKASPEVRRFGAEDLLKLGHASATDLAIELLRSTGDVSPAIAVCDAIIVVASQSPATLDRRLVPPLLDLLGSPDVGLRSRAAEALAGVRDPAVSAELGKLAGSDAPLVQRLAAVNSLAFDPDSRAVVEQLVGLLDTPTSEVLEQVIAALREASRQDYGSDIEKWKLWWKRKSELDEQSWYLDRLQLLRRQVRQLRQSAQDSKIETTGRIEALANRLRLQLEQTFRMSSAPQSDELLIRWLGEPLVEVRLAAIALVAADIADNHRPSEPIRNALRERLADESPLVRRCVMDVVAALTDPSDAERVRQRLKQETDPSVREAILRTLGRLQDPASIAVLTAQLADDSAPQGCVIEAALSLGMLGVKDKIEPAAISDAIAPLKQRFAAAPVEDLALRAALLSCMANLGRAEFAQEFNANLDAAEPDLLLPALDGIREIGDSARLERVLVLISHGDPRVRRRAIQAVAGLGGPTHAETLFARVSPNAESSDIVRQMAWDGLMGLLSRANVETRLQWSERMMDLPERREAYLLALEQQWSQSQPASPELAEVQRRLAGWFDSKQRYAESLPRLVQLLNNSGTEGDLPADVVIPLIRAQLALGRYEELGRRLTDLVKRATLPDRASAGTLLLNHFRSEIEAGRAGDLAALQTVIDGLTPDALGPEFRAEWQNLGKIPTTAPAKEAASAANFGP